MIRPLREKVKNKERVWMFRAKLMKLYEEFEVKLEALCQQHGVEINFWYSPSNIPQPKFVFGRVAITADTLYDEEEFSLLFSPKSVWEKRRKSTKESRSRERSKSDNLRL